VTGYQVLVTISLHSLLSVEEVWYKKLTQNFCPKPYLVW